MRVRAHARLLTSFPSRGVLACRLDFVRRVDERIPSDDEEEEDDDGKDDDSYKDDTESAASLSQSQSQTARPPKSRTSPRRSSAGSRQPRAARGRGQKKEDDVRSSDDGREGGKGGKGRRGKRGGRGGGEDAGGKPAFTGDEAAAAATEGSVDGNGDVTVTAVVSSSPASDRHARRLRRRHNGGTGPSAVVKSTAAAAKNASRSEEISRPSSSQPSTPPPPPPPSPVAGTPSRKSARLERGRQAEGEWRVGGGSGGKGEKAEEAESGESDSTGTVGHKDGLPFVQTVEDLRRFVRLEGSVVGHGSCMWADTFAHHVVSRRLKITILFVDMVSGARKARRGPLSCFLCCFSWENGSSRAAAFVASWPCSEVESYVCM